jgi:hypothetical protein
MENKIPVYLSEEEACLFKKFQQYRNDFEILLEAGFFDFKNGLAKGHRDFNGKLRRVEIEKVAFKC